MIGFQEKVVSDEYVWSLVEASRSTGGLLSAADVESSSSKDCVLQADFDETGLQNFKVQVLMKLYCRRIMRPLTLTGNFMIDSLYMATHKNVEWCVCACVTVGLCCLLHSLCSATRHCFSCQSCLKLERKCAQMSWGCSRSQSCVRRPRNWFLSLNVFAFPGLTPVESAWCWHLLTFTSHEKQMPYIFCSKRYIKGTRD